MKNVICKRCGGPTAQHNVWEDAHRHWPDCVFFLTRKVSTLEAVRTTAQAVAGEDWRTSVSENQHFRRIAKMDALRSALDAAIPPQADQQKELAGTVNKETPNSEKEKGGAE